jgi:GT2 family glycosyltransferase
MKNIISESGHNFDLSVSIVHFGNSLKHIDDTLVSLSLALNNTYDRDRYQLFLVDNGPDDHSFELEALLADNNLRGSVLSGHGNVGYGSGHNLAFAAANSRFHLILNPDIVLEPDALAKAVAFMNDKPDCGLLTPSFFSRAGQRIYLCKRYPSISILALRAFAPGLLKGFFMRRSWFYEMRDTISDSVYWDPEIASGCFMFFRSDIFKRLGGFDRRYFLYFEDFDISLRLRTVSRIAYVPEVMITHLGGGAAQKGLKHILMFCRSAFSFFNTYGWKFI